MRGDLWPSAVLADAGRRGRRSALRAWLLYGLMVPLLSGLLLTPLPAGEFIDFTVCIWCLMAVPGGVGQQRLHDIGRSGNWIWLLAAVVMLGSWLLPFGLLMITLPNPLGPTFAASVEAASANLTMAMVWSVPALPLLVWPGQRGSNRYGPRLPAGQGSRQARLDTGELAAVVRRRDAGHPLEHAARSGRIRTYGGATAFGDRSMSWMPRPTRPGATRSRTAPTSLGPGHLQDGRMYLNFAGHGEEGEAMQRRTFGANDDR